MTLDPHTIHTIRSSAASRQWNSVGIDHHHGIALSLTSLHSGKSTGIGDFFDMIPLIDWCSEVGFNVIQLLPLNDSGDDPSPYNALSALAINPVFLSLRELPNSATLLKRLSSERPRRNKRVHYHAVKAFKEKFMRQWCAQESRAVTTTRPYADFLADHPWLRQYTLFRILKEKYQTPWTKWPNAVHSPSEETLDRLADEHKTDVEFYSLMQFFCFQQLQQIKQYAESKNVFLKGDLPILISTDSADVWGNRSLFNTDVAAGAPPDAYAAQGQKWGFPTYNWEAIAANDYRFWRKRLEDAERFYHLYRLDHIVGFYRIWTIPPHNKATEGYFVPEDHEQWLPHGERILRMMLDSSILLPIGEDLGTVPTEVRANMRHLGICGTKVMRWERRWEEDRSYIPLEEYPPESMTCLSTHDSETLQQWWKLQPEEAGSFAAFKGWDYHPDLTLAQRKMLLRDSHHSGSLFHINLLQEYLAMVPELVWDKPEDERINVPATVSKRNWTYRFRCPIEEIASSERLRAEIRDVLR